MLCDADCMVLHARRATYVAQDNNLRRTALLEGRLLLSILAFRFDLLALLVDKFERLVLVGVVLGRKGEQDDGKEGGQGDDRVQDNVEPAIERVGEQLFAEHCAGLRLWEAAGPCSWEQSGHHVRGSPAQPRHSATGGVQPERATRWRCCQSANLPILSTDP